MRSGSNVFAALLAFFGLSATPARALVEVSFDVMLPAVTPMGGTICIAGDFQKWKAGATPLTRDSPTHAHGVIRVPEGGRFEFKFTRGSWAAGEKALDGSELPNRTATATAGTTIAATVANWADLCVPVYDTRAERVRIESATLGVAKEFFVSTPPGYALSPTRRYPVLYLFRGHESEWINKNQDSTRGGRNIIDLYEELLAAGEVGPMMFVFPGVSSDDHAVSGMVTNFRAPQLTGAPGIGTGRFEDYLLTELIPYVDQHYRTIAAKSGRGVAGFSLGGFMSVKIAAQHPELFSTVGAFDGTHFYANDDGREVDAARDANTFVANGMFDSVFGRPRDTVFAALNNGPNLIQNSIPEAMQSLEWFIQYGPQRAEPDDSNFFRGEHLLEKLRGKGVTNGVSRVLHGGHNWKTADEHMRQTLPLHWRALVRRSTREDS